MVFVLSRYAQLHLFPENNHKNYNNSRIIQRVKHSVFCSSSLSRTFYAHTLYTLKVLYTTTRGETSTVRSSQRSGRATATAARQTRVEEGTCERRANVRANRTGRRLLANCTNIELVKDAKVTV